MEWNSKKLVSEYNRRYYLEHKDKIKKYREEHKDEIREYQRKYREEHKDEIWEKKRKKAMEYVFGYSWNAGNKTKKEVDDD